MKLSNLLKIIIFSNKVFDTAEVGLPETIQMQHGKPNCNLFMNASFKNQFCIKDCKNQACLNLKDSLKLIFESTGIRYTFAEILKVKTPTKLLKECRNIDVSI